MNWDIVESFIVDTITKNILSGFNKLLNFVNALITMIARVFEWIRNLY